MIWIFYLRFSLFYFWFVFFIFWFSFFLSSILISYSWLTPQSHCMNHIRTKIRFSLLRSILLAIRKAIRKTLFLNMPFTRFEQQRDQTMILKDYTREERRAGHALPTPPIHNLQTFLVGWNCFYGCSVPPTSSSSVLFS